LNVGSSFYCIPDFEPRVKLRAAVWTFYVSLLWSSGVNICTEVCIMKGAKFGGFVLVIVFWTVLTILCYFRVVVFDSSGLGGAMLLSFVLTSSMLGIVQILKIMYDKAYSLLLDNEDRVGRPESSTN
jgi:hypothetical protein